MSGTFTDSEAPEEFLYDFVIIFRIFFFYLNVLFYSFYSPVTLKSTHIQILTLSLKKYYGTCPLNIF